MTRNTRVTPSEIASCIYDTTGEAIQSLLWIELLFRAGQSHSGGILVSVSRAAHDCSELTATESAGSGLGSATQQFPTRLNDDDHRMKS
jgi:hypothetical protein